MAEPDLTISRLGLDRRALSGQVAVVTGAGRGIGLEIARALAWLGAQVVIAELSDEGAAAEAAVRDLGGTACFVRTDVSDPASVAALAARTRERFGRVGVLVNNAIACPVAPVLEMDLATWDRVMAVNLRGTFLCCKTFLPDLLAGGGSILNLISTDAMGGMSAYIASKQGIAAFSRSLAAEVSGTAVRVVALAPGFVDTPGLRAAGAGLAPRLGMTLEAFLRLSLHPAYDGAMPAADAGAAAAYLVARLADRFHGEAVTGYSVLEEAGYLQPGAPAGGASAERVGGAPAGDNPAAVAAGCLRLQQVVAETEADFVRLPLFVRPLARGAFKQRTGHDMREWTAFASRLHEWAQGAAAGHPGAAHHLRAGYRDGRERLGRLVAYYEAAPAETARFTRDAAVLAGVRETMAARTAAVRSLLAALAALDEAHPPGMMNGAGGDRLG